MRSVVEERKWAFERGGRMVLTVEDHSVANVRVDLLRLEDQTGIGSRVRADLDDDVRSRRREGRSQLFEGDSTRRGKPTIGRAS